MRDEKLTQKWEKILQAKGLGIYQPMTDNSEGELADVPIKRVKGGDANSTDFAKLREIVDGGDLFMGGFQITKVRTVEREIPEWALNNARVQEILKSSFKGLDLSEPKTFAEKKKQKKRIRRAGRWARIIYLYYRMGLPRQIVAKELGMGEGTLKSTLRNIERAARGLTANSGTARKDSATPLPPIAVTGEKGDATK